MNKLLHFLVPSVLPQVVVLRQRQLQRPRDGLVGLSVRNHCQVVPRTLPLLDCLVNSVIFLVHPSKHFFVKIFPSWGIISCYFFTGQLRLCTSRDIFIFLRVLEACAIKLELVEIFDVFNAPHLARHSLT